MGKIKLFLLPYAGGTSNIYVRWKKYLHETIDMYPIELAGRGNRNKVPLMESIDDIVNDVFRQVQAHVDSGGPYMIFGHSMGSLIAYELVHKIMESGYSSPVHIFFSGRKSPNIEGGKIIYNLTFDEFKEEILKMGGTTEDFFTIKGLTDVFVPILRADFKAVDTYKYNEKECKLQCDISILNGEGDNIPFNHINEWKIHTDKDCQFYNFKGNHFFLNDNFQEVIKVINNIVVGIPV